MYIRMCGVPGCHHGINSYSYRWLNPPGIQRLHCIWSSSWRTDHRFSLQHSTDSYTVHLCCYTCCHQLHIHRLRQKEDSQFECMTSMYVYVTTYIPTYIHVQFIHTITYACIQSCWAHSRREDRGCTVCLCWTHPQMRQGCNRGTAHLEAHRQCHWLHQDHSCRLEVCRWTWREKGGVEGWGGWMEVPYYICTAYVGVWG